METTKCEGGCYIKCQSNAVSYFQITTTYKNFNSSLQIVVTNSGSKPIEKWVNCELEITIFTENGLDTVANVMGKCFSEV